MASLDELLLESGAMTKAQLRIVRKEQDKHGGSLDANILALGYLTEAALQRLMSRLWKDSGEVDYQSAPSKDALELLEPTDAIRIPAVPHSLLGSQLVVFVNDPAGLEALGELDALADFDLVGIALNEVRLRSLLEKHYHEPCPKRYAEIMKRIEARTSARAEAMRHPRDSFIGDPMAGLEPAYLAGAIVVERPDSGAQPATQELDPDVIPLLEDELLIEVIEEDEEQAEAEEAGERALQEAHQTLAAEEFSAALDALTSMDGLPDVFFRFGVPFFKSVALFKVQSNMMMGWKGAGLGIQSELIRGIVVPVQSDTFLARGVAEGPYAGQAGGNPVEERITEQLGAANDSHAVAAAVKVGERPVLVVCGLTEDEPPADEVIQQLGQLCELASQTVLRLIMERKKQKKAETGDTEPEDTKTGGKDEPADDKKGAKKKGAKKKGAKKKGAKKKSTQKKS